MYDRNERDDAMLRAAVGRALRDKGYQLVALVIVPDGGSRGLHLTARPEPGKQAEPKMIMGRTEAELMGEIARWERAGSKPKA